ncbi:unnamed protein product [Rotaria socialis]|uniref:Uncharacterized protein n=1 Tax=Rotaria socialis TaxID=392032 RepID=A0A820IFH3_9BILA|nr:unnamed protein product [Rotaria socialis]
MDTNLRCNNKTQGDIQRTSVVVDENKAEKELKELRDKVKDLQARHTEAKSQLDITKQELKKTQKALEKEVGDSVNIQAILNGTVNWRGRQQQILALQDKVNELKARANMMSTNGFNEDWDGNSLGSKYDDTMSVAQQRHRDDIRRIERDRKDLFEQQKQEMQSIRNEQQALKDKLEQSKTRNTILSNEVKTLREQLRASLDKSKHDDELVAVLLKQQQQMKVSNEQLQKDLDMKSKMNTELEQTQKLDQMKQTNMIKQLQLVLDQKETKLRELEMHLDENRIDYEKDDTEIPSTLVKPDESLTFVNITSRHTPVQNVTLAPMQLTALKHSTTDPVLNRLEKNGFTNTSSSRPPSAANAKRTSEDNDLKCINSALEVERNRLVDFIQTLQKRLDNANSQIVDRENKLIEQRKVNVRLEKDMDKVKLDLNNVKNRTVKGRGTAPSLPKSVSMMSDSRETIEELEMRLTLKAEENDALKNAMKSMLDAKEEDLKLYNETIQSVKDIFLQGIQHYKPLQTTRGST